MKEVTSNIKPLLPAMLSLWEKEESMGNQIKAAEEGKRKLERLYYKPKAPTSVKGKVDKASHSWYHHCRNHTFVMLNMDYDCELCGGTWQLVKEGKDGEVQAEEAM